MELELKPGEKICPKCKGEGAILFKHDLYADLTCDKCLGSGKLDWIEMAMGKRPRYVSPGVYVKEVDHSLYVSGPVTIREIYET